MRMRDILLARVVGGGTGGSGSGGVSSWNELTDKPFGVETYESKEIVLETTLAVEENSAGLFNIPDCVLPLDIGKTYIVTYNGTEYSCIAGDAGIVNPEFAGMGCIGNLALFMQTGDTGEPFIVMYAPGNGMQIFDISGASSITISITLASGETVHKIDKKYIPNDANVTYFKLTPLEGWFHCNGSAIVSLSEDMLTQMDVGICGATFNYTTLDRSTTETAKVILLPLSEGKWYGFWESNSIVYMALLIQNNESLYNLALNPMYKATGVSTGTLNPIAYNQFTPYEISVDDNGNVVATALT